MGALNTALQRWLHHGAPQQAVDWRKGPCAHRTMFYCFCVVKRSLTISPHATRGTQLESAMPSSTLRRVFRSSQGRSDGVQHCRTESKRGSSAAPLSRPLPEDGHRRVNAHCIFDLRSTRRAKILPAIIVRLISLRVEDEAQILESARSKH